MKKAGDIERSFYGFRRVDALRCVSFRKSVKKPPMNLSSYPVVTYIRREDWIDKRCGRPLEKSVRK